MCHVTHCMSCVTCHIGLASKATSTDPPPAAADQELAVGQFSTIYEPILQVLRQYTFKKNMVGLREHLNTFRGV